LPPAHVADDEPISRSVEAEAIRVPEAIGVDLTATASGAERIRRWHAITSVAAGRIGAAGILRRRERVDAQDLAEQVRDVLAVAEIGRVAIADVVRCTAVADRDVEVTITRAEADFAAVVVRLRIGDAENVAA
jgi:hypothetical protein